MRSQIDSIGVLLGQDQRWIDRAKQFDAAARSHKPVYIEHPDFKEPQVYTSARFSLLAADGLLVAARYRLRAVGEISTPNYAVAVSSVWSEEPALTWHEAALQHNGETEEIILDGEPFLHPFVYGLSDEQTNEQTRLAEHQFAKEESRVAWEAKTARIVRVRGETTIAAYGRSFRTLTIGDAIAKAEEAQSKQIISRQLHERWPPATNILTSMNKSDTI